MCVRISDAFESAFVHLQIQTSLPVSSAVGGKFIHSGNKLSASVCNAFTTVFS